MKTIKIILFILLLLFIIIQFFPKDLPDNHPVDDSDLISVIAIPDEMAAILRNSCYDCHSNQVKYPWYAYVAPTAWLVAKDVREGRSELNFSEWGDYSIRNLIGRLDAIEEEVTSGSMPLPVYTLMHRKTKLDEDQAEAIVKWAEEYTESIFE